MTYKIFGTTTCKFCKDAINLLREHNINYEYFQIDTEPAYMAEYKKLLPGIKTVPQIFDNQYVHIGGYTDLRSHLNDK